MIAVLTLPFFGCLPAASSPALPPPVRLAAPEQFTLYERDTASNKLQPHCTVRRLDGTVLSIRGDSVLLGNVQIRQQPQGATPCTRSDSLYAVVSGDSQVRAEASFAPDWKAIAVAVMLAPAIAYAGYLVIRTLGGIGGGGGDA